MALAARIRDLLEQVVLQTAQGSVPGFLITKACKEKTYLDRATQTIQLDSIRDQRLVKLGKREHFCNAMLYTPSSLTWSSATTSSVSLHLRRTCP
jgi:hypothetical protein